MKKTIIKTSVFALTFLISLFIIGKVMNQGHNNLTMEMAGASLPVIIMEKDGISYNRLQGYRQVMDTAYQRQTITELGGNRDTNFTIDTYGESVLKISIELRSVDGDRLVENSTVTGWAEADGQIEGRIALKDLMDADTEYMLIFILQTGQDDEIRYYTRVIWSENTYAVEKLQFVKEFHETLYDKEAAQDMIKYLESNSSGDNSTFHKVNIHSSFHQITWGDLNVKEELAPVICMTEIASQTASFLLDYTVSVTEEKKVTYYLVEEYYRLRYTSDRIYLLDYERTMTQIPDMGTDMYANDKIILGIVDENIPFVESEDGNIIVFEAAQRLCSYNIVTNKLVVLHSFYDDENTDARTLYAQHDYKILDVDEGGNVRFAVYGYMNRGRHEGEVGLQICYFDNNLNTVEEAIYIPYDKSYAILAAEMKQLLYMSREDVVYLFLDNIIYGIRLNEKTYEVITSIIQDDSMQVSANHKILVWQEGEDIYHSRALMMKDLNTGSETAIYAVQGDAIMPLGFMGEDVIYGLARLEDIVVENTGRAFFPMYKVCIQNSQGEILKEYQQSGYYVTECSVQDNQITLERIQKNESGSYQEARQDYILNNLEMEEGKNKLITVTTENFGKYVQIQARSTIDVKSLKVLTPKEVVFEGGRELELTAAEETVRYYVYGAYGVDGIYISPAKAIILAYSDNGVVTNERGDCVWLKGNRVTRNQIMAITENAVTEATSSLAVCLDTIFKFEGISRNSQYLLNQGQTVVDILQNNLEDAQVLELTGAALDAVLYYVNQDIPVLATLDNGEAVLITGFNEFNVVIMEPSTGNLYKKGINDSAEWFAENGNNFITYIRTE